MKTTQEYFNMTTEQLLEVKNEYGYTREECKLYDEGLKVHFCEDFKEYQKEKEDILSWYKKSQGLECILELKTINERIALMFN